MTLTDERRKALMKYLGEPEATSEYTVANSGDLVSVRTVIQNRTFDTDADMMALYRAIYKKKEWTDVKAFVYPAFASQKKIMDFDVWLFSLNGEGYEDRCCLVAEWLEVKK